MKACQISRDTKASVSRIDSGCSGRSAIGSVVIGWPAVSNVDGNNSVGCSNSACCNCASKSSPSTGIPSTGCSLATRAGSEASSCPSPICWSERSSSLLSPTSEPMPLIASPRREIWPVFPTSWPSSDWEGSEGRSVPADKLRALARMVEKSPASPVSPPAPTAVVANVGRADRSPTISGRTGACLMMLARQRRPILEGIVGAGTQGATVRSLRSRSHLLLW